MNRSKASQRGSGGRGSSESRPCHGEEYLNMFTRSYWIEVKKQFVAMMEDCAFGTAREHEDPMVRICRECLGAIARPVFRLVRRGRTG